MGRGAACLFDWWGFFWRHLIFSLKETTFWALKIRPPTIPPLVRFEVGRPLPEYIV